MAVMNLVMKNLVESQKRGQKGRNSRSQYGKARDLRGITFFLCHKKGHFQDNCTLEKKECGSP